MILQALRDLTSGLANQVVRGRHVRSVYSKDGQRIMVQLTGFAGETHQDVELLLPYGMTARPVGKTADLVVFQVNASRDHKIAIAGDDPALRIPSLAEGEFGFRDGHGQQVVFRKDRLEITSADKDVVVTATLGKITLNSKGDTDITVSSGNVNIGAANGRIALTAQPNQITANGNVLG